MRRLRRLERAGRVLDNRGFRVPRPAGGRHLAQRGFGVVHGDQNGALTGQVALVGGRFGLAHQRLATPEIENRKTHLPLFHGLDAVGQNQFREIAGEQLDNPRQADVREQTCGLYADLSVRGVQLCFGDGDVRAAAQQAGRGEPLFHPRPVDLQAAFEIAKRDSSSAICSSIEVAGPRQHACVVDSCNDGASTIGGVGPDKHCIGARNRTIRADRQDRTDFS